MAEMKNKRRAQLRVVKGLRKPQAAKSHTAEKNRQGTRVDCREDSLIHVVTSAPEVVP